MDVDPLYLFEAAKSGARHGGIYRDALKKSMDQLEKSIVSHTNQVLTHKDKMDHPSQYDLGWSEKDVRQQEGLLKKWEKDMRRNAEQAEIEIEVWRKLYGDK